MEGGGEGILVSPEGFGGCQVNAKPAQGPEIRGPSTWGINGGPASINWSIVADGTCSRQVDNKSASMGLMGLGSCIHFV